MKWNKINSVNEIRNIVERSHEIPCVIFKHSTRCSISSMAKMRLESSWDISDKEIEPYFLDLIAYRNVSNFIAEELKVHHESPQIILIKNGKVTYDASHLDITVDELKEVSS